MGLHRRGQAPHTGKELTQVYCRQNRPCIGLLWGAVSLRITRAQNGAGPTVWAEPVSTVLFRELCLVFRKIPQRKKNLSGWLAGEGGSSGIRGRVGFPWQGGQWRSDSAGRGGSRCGQMAGCDLSVWLFSFLFFCFT